MATANGARDNRYLEMVIHELERIDAQLVELNKRALYVLQFTILVFGAVGVVALTFPVAGAAMAIFWGAWFLYAEQIDRYSMKLEAITIRLEQRANTILTEQGREPLFMYRSTLAHLKTNNADKLLHTMPYAIAGLLQAGATAAGVFLICTYISNWWLVPYSIVTLGIATALAFPAFKRKDTAIRFEGALDAFAGNAISAAEHDYGWFGGSGHK